MNQPTAEQRERALEVIRNFHGLRGDSLTTLIAQALADESTRATTDLEKRLENGRHLYDALKDQFIATNAEYERSSKALSRAVQELHAARHILSAILYADERGQGVGFKEAMDEAQKFLVKQ